MSTKPPVASQRRRFTSIPGFSDAPGLPRLGKLRLGVKKTTSGGKEYPTEVDYFVFDPEESMSPDQRKELSDRFTALYGERAVTIHPVMFVTPDREEAVAQSLKWYGANKLLCHGNGIEAERLNRASGEWEPRQTCSNSAVCPEWNDNKCKFVTTLRFMLPEVSMAGYFQLDTGSKFSSANLRNAINLLESLFKRIHGIPLTLSRAPQKIEHEGKAQTHYIVHLWAPQVPLAQMQAIAASSMLALPDATLIEPDDDDIPADVVPASAQVEEEPVSEEIAARIETGFTMLGYNEATRESLKAQFPRQNDLLDHLTEKWREKNAAGVGA